MPHHPNRRCTNRARRDDGLARRLAHTCRLLAELDHVLDTAPPCDGRCLLGATRSCWHHHAETKLVLRAAGCVLEDAAGAVALLHRLPAAGTPRHAAQVRIAEASLAVHVALWHLATTGDALTGTAHTATLTAIRETGRALHHLIRPLAHAAT